MFDGSYSDQRVGARVMSMWKQLDIDLTVICVTSDMAANMKNAIEALHSRPHCMVWMWVP